MTGTDPYACQTYVQPMLQAGSFSNNLTGEVCGPEPQEEEGDVESVAAYWTIIKYGKQQQFLQVCSFPAVF